METKNYRPKNIEFEVSTNEVPENLGEFKDAKDAIHFMQKNFVSMNEKITTLRFIDLFEKSEIRKNYSDLLENKLPYLKKDLQKAEIELKEAKDRVNDLKDQVNGTQNEAEGLAVQVKIGTKEINLDDNFTWRVAFSGKYFYYTFIDNQIKLAKIREIPSYEKADLYNNESANSVFFSKANDIYEKFISGEISSFDFAKLDTGIEFDILKEKDENTTSDEERAKE